MADTCKICGQKLQPLKLDETRNLNGVWTLSTKECPGLFSKTK